MAQHQTPREKIARVMCRRAGHPESIAFEGKPMWESYLTDADAILKALGIHEAAVNLVVNLSEPEAEAFAQFLKRADPEDYRKRAGDQKEANLIEQVAQTIRNALAMEGFAPR